MQQEMESLYKNRTWDLCELHKGRRTLTAKWIYKRKEGIPGRKMHGGKHAWLFVDTTKRKVYYNEVFSPVVRHTSIRVLLAFVALFDMELEQFDVKTAFLHGVLEDEIYMKQPEGFIVPGKEQHVCRLKKSLYGLKRAPRQWYKKFDTFMIGQGYTRSWYDNYVYFR